MPAEPENAHISGTYHGSLSLKPLFEVMSFIKNCDDYTKNGRADANSSIYRAHPGIKSVMVTDMAGLDYIFDAPPEELDRLEDEPGFGGLSLNRFEMLEGVIPALVAHTRPGGNHDAGRALVAKVLELRRDHFAPACERVLRNGTPLLADLSVGQRANFAHALHEAAIGICFEWLFGIHPGPSGENAETWLEGCFGLKTDGTLSNFVSRKLSRLKNGPREAIIRYSAATHDAIRACEPYPQFVEAAKEVGVPEAEIAGHLMFAGAFNGTAGAWAIQFPALAQLFVDPRIREAMVADLAAFDGDPWKLDSLPFLHDFFLESIRLFGRPRHYYRRALVDVEIPRSIGEPVKVAKGSTICLVSTVARQDPTVFGNDAAAFDPWRYERHPELRDRIKAFGPPIDARNTFGCVGHAAGVSQILWKTSIAAFARDTNWKLVPYPEPDVGAFEGVRPGVLEYERL